MKLQITLVGVYTSVFLLVLLCYVCDSRSIDTNLDMNATLAQNESRNETNQTESRGVITTLPPTAENQADTEMAMQMKDVQDGRLTQYKSATIGLAVACGLMFLALVYLSLRYRAKRAPKETPEADSPLAPVKELVESEYQSIRGLPRRETGNSYGYETVKPKLPNTRPPIAFLLQANNEDYENLKSRVRESNIYVPMDEALVGSVLTGSALAAEGALTGSAIILSGDDEDLYLTMKRLMRTSKDGTAVDTRSCDIGDV